MIKSVCPRFFVFDRVRSIENPIVGMNRLDVSGRPYSVTFPEPRLIHSSVHREP